VAVRCRLEKFLELFDRDCYRAKWVGCTIRALENIFSFFVEGQRREVCRLYGEGPGA
jgi:hypothetical protein